MPDPYMVLVYRNGGWPHTTAMREEVSRCVVGTLEEAQEAAHVAAQSSYGPTHVPARTVLELAGISESGGTVGPLGDGTAIEVWPVTETRMREVEAGAW